MMIGDLLFIAVVLTVLIVLIRALYLLARRRYGPAGRVFLRLGIGLVVYFAVLISVSLVARQKILAMGQDRCFDDWCLAVENASTAAKIGAVSSQGEFHIVSLRVSSQAKRVSQRALDASVYIADTQGHRYEPSDAGQRAYEAQSGAARPLSDRLEPGESYTTVRVFDVPRDAQGLGLVVEHGAFPGCIIIGDSQSLFHKRTVTMLP